MCGIAGVWTPGGLEDGAIGAVQRMTDALQHRGPDDAGSWCDAQAGVAFGHRRLSIIDLSPHGRQPMISPGGRYVMIYNGEVYNFQELRLELEARGAQFRGSSDTEVMLAAIERRGLVDAVRSFVGMFAFALFDRADGTLHLVRDRVGEKPLYYSWAGRSLLFGSELKALRANPNWRGEIDRRALTLLLRYNYIPAPYSIYHGVKKVLPGTALTFKAGEGPREVEYWSARQAAESGVKSPFRGTAGELADQLDALLRRTVRREMISDVPLGAFLSGGVDSSLVVAMMQAQSPRPIRTFTIGFHEPEYNEAENAKAVARHLRTDHTELYVTPTQALAVVPQLPTLYDEPFSDASQIPTYLVSELTRRHVTVSLSGDGGDELFGGYDRYDLGRRLWRWLRPIPRRARQGIAQAIRAIPPHRWDQLLRSAGRAIADGLGARVSGDRLHKFAEILSVESAEAMYRDLMTHWRDAARAVRGGGEPSTVLTDVGPRASVGGVLPLMMYLDLISYLPDDILVKVDRASMGVSLESRAPYLDHEIVEFAWRVPLHLKVRNGRGKWLLRQLLYRYVPPKLVDRPKMGFGVPLDHWLRGPLRDWAAALLDERRLRSEGFFNPAAIGQKWVEHQSGSRNWQYLLWDVLMFQAWLEAQ